MSSLSFAQTSLEASKDLFLKQIENKVSKEQYKKIESINFQKLNVDDLDPSSATNYNQSIKQLDETADKIICLNGLPPESLQLEEFGYFAGAIERSLIKSAKTIPCNPFAKETLSTEELNQIWKKLKESHLFNNDHPNAACFERTYLISKELDKLGYKSRQLHVEGWILAAYQKDKFYGVEGYDVHKVNLVKVQTANGELDFVLDPMFLDAPMELSQYKKHVTHKTNNTFSIRDQDDHNRYYKKTMDGDKKILEKAQCSYNELLLEMDLDFLENGKFDYQKQHEKIVEKKFLSRQEALRDAKKAP